MGGPNNSQNFLLNCEGWKKIRGQSADEVCVKENYSSQEQLQFLENIQKAPLPKIRLAPITGGVENIGYGNEKQFYFDMINACSQNNLLLSIGDGTPDYKLQFGLEALKTYGKKAAVFIKPYPQKKYFERMEWALPSAEIVGVDIDSYNIVTMRNLVNLEKKTSEQLLEIKNHLASKKIPFAIKGVFTPEDIQMVKEVKPDIIYISNHGGRVDQIKGSTAEFLRDNHDVLLQNCSELWVDGGLRTKEDLLTATYFDATTVLLGRPLISALCRDKTNGIKTLLEKLS